jgi:hypothetical protein
MTKEEALTIIAKHRGHSWKLWFKPWAIQDDLLCLSDYFQEQENPFEKPCEDTDLLKKQLEEKEKALKAFRAWIFATFGPNASFGPPRDLLQDKFKLVPNVK